MITPVRTPPPILKYPRTPHLEGSRLQPGDDDLDAVKLSSLRGAHLVVEEKVDGANSGIRFDDEGHLWLQSRGHFLTGGAREKHFNLFKQWAESQREALHRVLGARYALYGEWLYAKHTVFYDALPHYFLEYDVFDAEAQRFLSTAARRRLLAGAPIASVPVLREGPETKMARLVSDLGPSRYKSASWREALVRAAERAGLDAARAWRETDGHDEMEGLYVKAEEGDYVTGRYKFIRPSFLTAVVDSGSHWLQRPIVENALAEGASLFGSERSP